MPKFNGRNRKKIDPRYFEEELLEEQVYNPADPKSKPISRSLASNAEELARGASQEPPIARSTPRSVGEFTGASAVTNKVWTSAACPKCKYGRADGRGYYKKSPKGKIIKVFKPDSSGAKQIQKGINFLTQVNESKKKLTEQTLTGGQLFGTGARDKTAKYTKKGENFFINDQPASAKQARQLAAKWPKAGGAGSAEAKKIADHAAKLFAGKKYLKAAKLFEKSYSMDKEKSMRLRNAGRSYEEAGDTANALARFKTFLTVSDHKAARADVEARIQRSGPVTTAAAPTAAAQPAGPAAPAAPQGAAAGKKAAGVEGDPRWAPAQAEAAAKERSTPYWMAAAYERAPSNKKEEIKQQLIASGWADQTNWKQRKAAGVPRRPAAASARAPEDATMTKKKKMQLEMVRAQNPEELQAVCSKLGLQYTRPGRLNRRYRKNNPYGACKGYAISPKKFN